MSTVAVALDVKVMGSDLFQLNMHQKFVTVNISLYHIQHSMLSVDCLEFGWGEEC